MSDCICVYIIVCVCVALAVESIRAICNAFVIVLDV